MTEKQPRFRSPPFPYIGLGRAIEKADQLYGAVRNHAAALPTAAKAWETGPKSSATLQSVAALIQYGLLDDEGSGEARKVKLTPLALKIVMDKRPESEERKNAIKQAAISPSTFREIYDRFGAAQEIDDALLHHALTAERVQEGRAPFSDQSASDVLRVYRDTISFAGMADADLNAHEPHEESENEALARPRAQIVIGSYVQWVSNGVAQFGEPKRVRALSEDQEWAFVDGSETGLPLSELEVFDTPQQRGGTAPPRLPLPERDPTVHERADPKDKDRMKVVWEGDLIHINATVDRLGLARLRKKLDAMEALLDDQ